MDKKEIDHPELSKQFFYYQETIDIRLEIFIDKMYKPGQKINKCLSPVKI